MRKAWAALADEGDEIDDELLSAVSNSYLKRAQANFEGDGGALLVRPLDSDSVEEIEKMLAEAGVAPVRMQEIMGNLERKTYEASKLARAKQRIDLDENFATTLTNEAGEAIQVKMSDLFDNDVESVMARYLREVTGWSALSSKLNVRNRAQLDRFQSNLKLDAKRAGDDVKDLERMVDIGIKSTFGRSTELDPASKGSRYARALRNWNFSRVMNQVGFSLFAELGPTIAHAGVRNFVDSTLAAKEFLIRGADGKLTSKEARVMESLFAPGTDWLRNPPFMRMDDDARLRDRDREPLGLWPPRHPGGAAGLLLGRHRLLRTRALPLADLRDGRYRRLHPRHRDDHHVPPGCCGGFGCCGGDFGWPVVGIGHQRCLVCGPSRNLGYRCCWLGHCGEHLEDRGGHLGHQCQHGEDRGGNCAHRSSNRPDRSRGGFGLRPHCAGRHD